MRSTPNHDRVDWGTIGMLAVVAVLVMFGVAYNFLMDWLGNDKEGYTAFCVALGTLVTLVGAFFVTQFQPAPWWVVLVCFAASGTPMILGDVIKSVKARKAVFQRSQEKADKALEGLE